MSGETSFNCVTPIVLYLVIERGWTLPDAITVAATNCERCMNILLEETTGEPYLERDKAGTHCDLCAIVDPEYDAKYKEIENRMEENGEFSDEKVQPMVKDSSVKLDIKQRAVTIAKYFLKKAEDDRYEEFQNNTYVIFIEDAKFKIDQLDAMGEIKKNMIGKVKKVTDSTVMVEIGKQLYEIPLLEAFKVMEPFRARVISEESEEELMPGGVPEEVPEEQPEGTEEAPGQARPSISTEREEMKPVPIKAPKKPLEKALETASVLHAMMRKIAQLETPKMSVGDDVWVRINPETTQITRGEIIGTKDNWYTVRVGDKYNMDLPAERLIFISPSKSKGKSVEVKEQPVEKKEQMPKWTTTWSGKKPDGIVVTAEMIDTNKIIVPNWFNKETLEDLVDEKMSDEDYNEFRDWIQYADLGDTVSEEVRGYYVSWRKEHPKTDEKTEKWEQRWRKRSSLKKKSDYDHLTVQTSDIPKELENQIKDIQSKIDKDMLNDSEDEEGWVEGGLQKLFHSTVLYGVNPKDRDAISEVVKETIGEEGILARTGEIEYFDNKDEGHTAMIIRIESEGLKELHDKLKAEFENKDKYPEYKSHTTIAYLKLGNRVEGIEITPVEWKIDGIEVSEKDGSLTRIAESLIRCVDCANIIDDQEATDIQLCSKCMENYDVDKLWEMHNRGETDVLDFNENAQTRKEFRISGEPSEKTKKWEERWHKRSNKGVVGMEKIILGQIEISDQMLDEDGMWLSRDLWEQEVNYRVEMIEQYLGNVERGINVIGNIRSYLDDLEEILEKVPPSQMESAQQYLNRTVFDKSKKAELIVDLIKRANISETAHGEGNIDMKKPLKELNKIIKKRDKETMKMQKNDEKGRIETSTPPQDVQRDVSLTTVRNTSLNNNNFKKGGRVQILKGIHKGKAGAISECRSGHGFNIASAYRVIVGDEAIWYKENEIGALTSTDAEISTTVDSEFPAVEADIQAGFRVLINEMDSHNPYVVNEIGRKLYKQQQKQNKEIVRDGMIHGHKN